METSAAAACAGAGVNSTGHVVTFAVTGFSTRYKRSLGSIKYLRGSELGANLGLWWAGLVA